MAKCPIQVNYSIPVLNVGRSNHTGLMRAFFGENAGIRGPNIKLAYMRNLQFSATIYAKIAAFFGIALRILP